MCVAATACGVGPTDSIDDSASSAADLKSAPKVDSVTPSEATIGVLTTFTVTGFSMIFSAPVVVTSFSIT